MTLQQQITQDAIILLKQLIGKQSFSREENLTGDILEEFFRERNMPFRRKINNLWAKNKHFNKDLPTVLLNSHHDTVKPNSSWTLNPFPKAQKDLVSMKDSVLRYRGASSKAPLAGLC